MELVARLGKNNVAPASFREALSPYDHKAGRGGAVQRQERAEMSSTGCVNTIAHGRHSNVCNSGSPPTRGVVRDNFMTRAHTGQSGALGVVEYMLFDNPNPAEKY